MSLISSMWLDRSNDYWYHPCLGYGTLVIPRNGAQSVLKGALGKYDFSGVYWGSFNIEAASYL